MFYRRKLILSVLETFGGKLGKINLQKLLFLIAKRQSTPVYEFIPYRFGSYSYSANADMLAMVKHGLLLDEENSFIKKDNKTYLVALTANDRMLVNKIYLLFKSHDADALMKYTYVTYPYFAINSTTAARLLNKEQLETVNSKRTFGNNITLFTIGYEGISLEGYLNKLVINNIKVLVDVRRNPLSQKFGFSKSQLINYCKSLNIQYVHFADVGIQSDKRQALNEQQDYDLLFNYYKKNTLPKTLSSQKKILELLIEKKRIALTCFEGNICQCHRKHLADAITLLPDWSYEIKHL